MQSGSGEEGTPPSLQPHNKVCNYCSFPFINLFIYQALPPLHLGLSLKPLILSFPTRFPSVVIRLFFLSFLLSSLSVYSSILPQPAPSLPPSLPSLLMSLLCGGSEKLPSQPLLFRPHYFPIHHHVFMFSLFFFSFLFSSQEIPSRTLQSILP